MGLINLPEELRPRSVYYKKCALGVDLPASFIYELKGIDDHLYPVWHGFKVLWDDIINEYAGGLEDPRYQIASIHGELNFGFTLTNGRGIPSPDGSWHIWRLCRPHGWAHVIGLETRDQVYLNLVLKRLWLQAKYNDRYGHRGYRKHLESLDEAEREKAMKDQEEMFLDIKKANHHIMNRVSQNFASGITKPTIPKKDIIVSGAGINKRSKIVRPITDREGGLILPD